MCKTVKVSASGCYGWLDRPVCQRQQANVALTAQIRDIFVASDSIYGMPRIRAELQDAGIVASRKLVGWAFGERMNADLVILALNMALMTRKPPSVIHHCDQW